MLDRVLDRFCAWAWGPIEPFPDQHELDAYIDATALAADDGGLPLAWPDVAFDALPLREAA